MILTFKKTFFTTISALLFSYFFLELFNFKEKIMTIQKNELSITSQIVILTGGTNRIKKGFEIINKFDEKSKNNIKEILLITSNYHMPRSILEFNNIMPNVKILPYPIKPEQHKINEWLKSFETFSLVFIEYCKYIVSNIRVKTL